MIEAARLSPNVGTAFGLGGDTHAQPAADGSVVRVEELPVHRAGISDTPQRGARDHNVVELVHLLGARVLPRAVVRLAEVGGGGGEGVGGEEGAEAAARVVEAIEAVRADGTLVASGAVAAQRTFADARIGVGAHDDEVARACAAEGGGDGVVVCVPLLRVGSGERRVRGDEQQAGVSTRTCAVVTRGLLPSEACSDDPRPQIEMFLIEGCGGGRRQEEACTEHAAAALRGRRDAEEEPATKDQLLGAASPSLLYSSSEDTAPLERVDQLHDARGGLEATAVLLGEEPSGAAELEAAGELLARVVPCWQTVTIYQSARRRLHCYR